MLGFALMVAGIAGCYYVNALFVPSPFVIAVQLAGVVLMVWARVTFGRRSFHPAAVPTAGGLVTTGPYRYLRHPIYTAAFCFVWPPALARHSLQGIACATLLSIGAIIRMLCEEQLLVRQYPEYVAYAKATRRMIPYVF
jgi:protein-S-isoprenylcysteine O-methyltransferase Ste14